ncbi:PTS sugar transporter subunit IIA [Melittangium boletus]|uniref:PTS IIA-like nitrogen-regulatory protein PtsN n=1 Tax=Melittangium boletus DSM 14713 TaxID=1294270 RepID=A0A250IFU2_9BACT|nr:PTS sugar transporter subunit IIA [Melittangium boletus]ATB30128.1 PTS IIA-like nitrogen-regulatory protein PtsN [Melittangium boletus DSM 14713]
MRFTEHLSEDCIVPTLWSGDRKGVLHELAGTLAASTGAPLRKVEGLLQAREHLCSTAIGEGIAIPHCRVERLRHVTACVAVHRGSGVDFGARDGLPVRLWVTLVSPAQEAGAHLRMLARIAALLRDARLRQSVLAAPSAAAIRSLFIRAEDSYLATHPLRHDLSLPAAGA